jgi:sugar O-acyltransferase (sialic acid O-acetyltransferase NeuD family)
MMHTDIVVLGGGGHAKVLIAILKKLHAYNLLGYTDPRQHGDILGIPYLGTDDALKAIRAERRSCAAAIGIGTVRPSSLRAERRQFLEALGFALPPIIAPTAIVNEDVEVGLATVIFDGVVVNPGCRIGDCVILNTHCTVEHDCTIEHYVHVAPGATLSGDVRVGSGSMIGAGATVIHSVSICANCLIGAGATVTEDISEPGVYVGTPARQTRQKHV